MTGRGVIGHSEHSEGSASRRAGPLFSPATGEKTGEVAFASAAEVDAAVAKARAAFPDWSRTGLGKRTTILFAFREIVKARSDELARCIVGEHGKVLADARGEVQRGLEVVEFACGIPQLLKGQFSQNVSGGVDSYTFRQPLGVVVGITPFNFPVMVPMWMYPIAIAAGNCFLLKPSEKDPTPSGMVAAMWREAGLPEGVFQVVNGGRETVDLLLAHRGVDAVSFVGSTPVARRVHEMASRHGKRVQALGGAKNHMVVLPDADMELAADSAVNAAFGSAGERCMAISVVVAVGAAGDALVPLIRDRIRQVRVGDGMDESSDMGPLITAEHLERVCGYLDEGVRAGAQLLADGRTHGNGKGFFLGPSAFDNVTEDMSIYRDEIFGPVLSIVRVPAYQDAIALVNRNPFANGVAIFTNDGGAARAFEAEIEVGMIGINVPIPVPMAYHSFGGWKQSLFGDVHVHGEEGVRFYTRAKVVTARWPEPRLRGKNLGFPTP